MGSNCVSCVEYHVPESRKAGLTDPEILAAIQHADKIRQVPARKTLQAALKLLPSAAGDAGGIGTASSSQPADVMAGMMSKMMAACGSHGQIAGAANSPEKKARGQSCGERWMRLRLTSRPTTLHSRFIRGRSFGSGE